MYVILYYKLLKFVYEVKVVEGWEVEELKMKSGNLLWKEGKLFESFLLVYNVVKRYNLGILVWSVIVFGVLEIIFVGWKDFNVFGSYGVIFYL